ncbi:MAG: RNA polymerase sigma factor [Candidatus Limnocylindrales bacterium]
MPDQATTLEALLAHEYDRLIRLAGIICRDPTDAQDAVQAAIERALRHRNALRDPGKVRSWLNQIIVREALRIERGRNRWRVRLGAPPREIEIGSPADDPARPEALAAAALRQAFERLPIEQRVVLALHHYAGYSMAETSQIVEAPLETVRSRLRLARARLRQMLDEVPQ